MKILLLHLELDPISLMVELIMLLNLIKILLAFQRSKLELGQLEYFLVWRQQQAMLVYYILLVLVLVLRTVLQHSIPKLRQMQLKIELLFQPQLLMD